MKAHLARPRPAPLLPVGSLAASLVASLLWITPVTAQEGTALDSAADTTAAPALTPAPAPTAGRTICPAVPAGTSTGIATSLDDLARSLEIRTGAPSSRMVRRHSEALWPGGCPGDPDIAPDRLITVPEVTIRPVRANSIYRTGYPDDRNNGALWAGRGLGTLLEVGVQVDAGMVSAAVVPQLMYQQNRAFQFPTRNNPGFSRFIYPHYTTHIDYPQRQGSEAFSSVEWGQSYVRADAYGLAAGFSTENLWWGPATRYPILMSNTAPGMPHLFFGTSGPTDIWIGRIDAELVFARARESDFFDQVPDNDQHILDGLALAFSPRPLPGLWLGFARVNHYADDGLWALDDMFAAVIPGGESAANQIVSMFARWAFTESGAEVYGEWAREDRSFDLPELVQEPDHSQAYMFGFQKLTPVHERFGVRVQGEIVALQELPELRTGSRPLPVYYTHDEVTQGHTHRGQLLGAGIGLGADAQFIAVDALADMGSAGLYLERVRRATFAARALDLRANAPYEHDTEITGGIRATFLSGNVTVAGGLAYTFRYNRDFQDDDSNWSLALEATWLPGTDLGLGLGLW